MLYCYGCLSPAHLYCYGIHTPYKKEQAFGEDVYRFICDKCRQLGPHEPRPCMICQDMKGLYKLTTSGNNWVHITCALFSNQFSVLSIQRMDIDEGDILEYKKRKPKRKRKIVLKHEVVT